MGTSSTASGGDSWRFRTALMLGHYYEAVYLVMMVLLAVFQFAHGLLGYHGAWSWIVSTVQLVLVGSVLLFLACEAFVHANNLCERCISDLPLLDPQGAIERHDRKLRFFHRHWWHIASSLGLLVAFWVPPNRVTHVPWVYVVLAVLVGIGAYSYRTTMIHRRLRTWCPYCKDNGGGGDFSPAPTPDPVGTVTA